MVDFTALRAPFPTDRVSWRVGSTNKDKTKGMALAYLDARDVMDRLDQVCGPEGWQCDYPHANGKTVCRIGIKVGDEWVWKADGAGDTDFEAEKGALSDAFKRSAVRWGIGRYLYDVDAPWVKIEAFGKSFKIDASEYPRLRRILPARIEGEEAKADPAPPSEVEPGDRKALALSEMLKVGLKHATTQNDLMDWAARDDVSAQIESLPEDLRGSVREAYKAHMKSLKEKEPA